MVYKFNLTSKASKMKDGIITLSIDDKARVLQFWGITSDIGRLLISNSTLSVETEFDVPYADESPIFLEGLI